jgi:hypothetical protein
MIKEASIHMLLRMKLTDTQCHGCQAAVDMSSQVRARGSAQSIKCYAAATIETRVARSDFPDCLRLLSITSPLPFRFAAPALSFLE